jgi:DNA relaxase NicK
MVRARGQLPVAGRSPLDALRPETIYFLGLTLYCARNQKGNFKVRIRTEKSRVWRSLMSLQEVVRRYRELQGLAVL